MHGVHILINWLGQARRFYRLIIGWMVQEGAVQRRIVIVASVGRARHSTPAQACKPGFMPMPGRPPQELELRMGGIFKKIRGVGPEPFKINQ